MRLLKGAIIVKIQAPKTLLAVLVAHDERTQEEILEGFNTCANDNREKVTLSERTFRRWLMGDIATKPRAAMRRVARLYWKHSMDELLDPPRSMDTTPVPRQRTAPAMGIESAMLEFEPTTASGVPSLQEFTGPANPRSSWEKLLTMSARRSLRFIATAEAPNLGPETLAELHASVQRLAGEYVREPAVTVLPKLMDLQDLVFRLLEERQRPSQAQDLYFLAGVINGLLAVASFDCGREHEAMTQARTMYVCADNIDHSGLKSRARALQSVIAYWHGRLREAVHYAQLGRGEVEGGTGSITAWLPALEGRAWGMLGHRAQAHSALSAARDARERATTDDLDHIGGWFTFPQARQHYYAASTYAFLPGDAALAEREAATAIDLYDPADTANWSFVDEAGARAELATARIHLGELDGAHEALAPVLDLSPDRRTWNLIESAMRIHRVLRIPQYLTSPTTRTLQGHIEEFCQLSPAAL
ncbi:MAG: hypothetical protein ACRDPW_08450, partial [Mycobacteriales bacterium]